VQIISSDLPLSLGNVTTFYTDPKWFRNLSLAILYALK
jgi:hypothetical protein